MTEAGLALSLFPDNDQPVEGMISRRLLQQEVESEQPSMLKHTGGV